MSRSWGSMEGAALLERALEYHDRAGEIRERALLLRRLHWTHLSRGEYETAIQLATRSRMIPRRPATWTA